MDKRKQQLFKLVLEHYIATAEPVSSKMLVDDVDVSGATIRNELRALEADGFLTHPHTSAGRIPTELGYRYYVQEIMQIREPGKSVTVQLQQIIDSSEKRKDILKTIAKLIAEKSGNAVMIAFDQTSVYYTGMACLFSQPEFQDAGRTVQVSAVFDHCEDRLHIIEELIAKEHPKTFIGQENPLGGACATVVTRLSQGELILCIGPMRMNYEENISFMHYLKNIL
jgi:heat-inducible transcriptional repressor